MLCGRALGQESSSGEARSRAGWSEWCWSGTGTDRWPGALHFLHQGGRRLALLHVRVPVVVNTDICAVFCYDCWADSLTARNALSQQLGDSSSASLTGLSEHMGDP